MIAWENTIRRAFIGGGRAPCPHLGFSHPPICGVGKTKILICRCTVAMRFINPGTSQLSCLLFLLFNFEKKKKRHQLRGPNAQHGTSLAAMHIRHDLRARSRRLGCRRFLGEERRDGLGCRFRLGVSSVRSVTTRNQVTLHSRIGRVTIRERVQMKFLRSLNAQNNTKWPKLCTRLSLKHANDCILMSHIPQ
jgi:hypothetical protein